jgi:tyrosine-protein kinase Etk/Wzc
MFQETLRQPLVTSTTTPKSEAGVNQHALEEQGVDPIEIVTLLLRQKTIILKFILLAASLTALLVFVIMRPMFTAQATFLPPQNAPGSGLSQLASQLGSLGAVGALGGLKSS